MRQHILTIVVEDYFHVAALRGAVLRKHWDRLEPRVEDNLTEVLALLARAGARATFFVWGRIAELNPALIGRIVAGGHEVASRGYWPRSVRDMDRDELLADCRAARAAIEAAGSHHVLGYRSPSWLRARDLWILDALAEEGYAYDSSLAPTLWRLPGDAELGIHRHRHPTRPLSIWEYPISTIGIGRLRLPVTGGNYVRQFPHTALKQAVAWKSDHEPEPMVFYFMSWEIDADQPQIQGISTLQRIRHYRNLGKARWVLEDYLGRYQFIGIADHLGLAHDDRLPVRPRAPEPSLELAPGGAPVTLVVPIFNEEKNVTYLRRTLLEFRRRLSGSYRIHLLLVDDCSTDRTGALLREQFAAVPECTVVRHEVNRGVAAAIMTGIRAAPTEVVASIDCDCSYDPQDLEKMLPLLADADMVTASPYHPAGQVFNVPSWRLFLSKSLSRMYSAILRERLHTYTSCCRVYRRSAMAPLKLEHGGFLGMAEMLIELSLAGGRVVEHPATLESRLLGESKMKIARTIRGHLRLIGDLVASGRRRAPARARPAHPAGDEGAAA